MGRPAGHRSSLLIYFLSFFAARVYSSVDSTSLQSVFKKSFEKAHKATITLERGPRTRLENSLRLRIGLVLRVYSAHLIMHYRSLLSLVTGDL